MDGPKSVFDIDLAELLEMNGSLLVEIREELGFSPQEMAEKLGCDRSTLNRYENERIKTYPASLIARVKKLLDEERAARNVSLSPDVETGGAAPPSRAPGFPIALARGPLAPGTKLVETIPVVETSTPVTRMFIAVESEEASREREEEQDLMAEGFGASSAAPVKTQKDAPSTFVSALFSRVPAPGRWAMTASLVLLFPMACFQAGRAVLWGEADRTSAQREPNGVPGQIYADNATKGAGGSGPAESSIPMPEKPYAWQKLAPCDRGETEKVGGCWLELSSIHPPCRDYAVESDGKCLMPIPAKPKRPSTVTPEQ